MSAIRTRLSRSARRCSIRNRTRFRLWAPAQDSGRARDRRPAPTVPMARSDGRLVRGRSRMRRRRALPLSPGDGHAVPDPASRAQADDVHGPSVVVDPRAYRWQHRIGAAGPGTRPSSTSCMPALLGGFARRRGASCRSSPTLGITAVELMPIDDFPGGRNWGYDGVLPFAPDRSLRHARRPEGADRRRAWHGLMIFLDVVYNHFGPDGNYLAAYAPHSFATTSRRRGAPAIDFRRPRGAPLLHRERAVLAARISLRRPALRRRARDQRTGLARRNGGRGPRDRRARPPSPSRARERRQRRRPSAPATSMRNGTTTAITSCTCC